MITEDYVSFETAKLLKEKGFDEQCYAYYNIFYDNDGKVLKLWRKYPHRAQPNSDYLNVPTLQMAMKWLREVHKIHISVEMGFDVDNHQYYFFVPSICMFSDKSGEYEILFDEKEFGTCEEACEAIIKYCLENLI